jgi:hydrogenase maturation protease
MSEVAHEKILIGIGNQERGDDAIGLWLARQLKARGLPGVVVRELHGDPTLLLDMWSHKDVVYLVDAVWSGVAPGTVHQMDARIEPLPGTIFRLSTHGTSVADAIELGRLFNRLPQRLVIYGIEGKSFDIGAPISPEAQRGAEQALEVVLRDLKQKEVDLCMSGD